MRRLLPIVLLALVAAGCGGKSSGSARLTHGELVSEANKVCIDSDHKVYRVGLLSADPAGWKKTADIADESVREMAKLRPPAKDAARFGELLGYGRDQAAALRKLHGALVVKSYTTARAAQKQATRDDTKVKRAARELGFTFCSQLLTNWPA